MRRRRARSEIRPKLDCTVQSTAVTAGQRTRGQKEGKKKKKREKEKEYTAESISLELMALLYLYISKCRNKNPTNKTTTLKIKQVIDCWAIFRPGRP